jgi:hypothetical protein
VQAVLGEAGDRLELAVDPGAVLLGAVVVAQVDVGVRDDRLRDEQDPRLALGVVGPARGVEADGRRVGGEEREPDERRAPYSRPSS